MSKPSKVLMNREASFSSFFKLNFSFLNVSSNNGLLEQCRGSALLGGFFQKGLLIL